MRKIRSLLAASFLITMLIQLSGCDRAVDRSAERRIREALQKTLGTAREYRVHVKSGFNRTLRGRLGDITIDGDEVRLTSGMLVESLRFDLKGVELDIAHRRLKGIRETRFRAIIRDFEVDKFLAREIAVKAQISNAHILFLEGSSLALEAEYLSNGEKIPFHMNGSLKISDPQHVQLNVDKLSITGESVTDDDLEFFRRKVENAIDLTKIPIHIDVTGVHTTQGKLIFEGTADLTSAAQKEKGIQK